MGAEIKVSILEKDAFKDRTVVIKLSRDFSEDEKDKLGVLLERTFPEAGNVLILGPGIDMELPPDTIVEAAPLEYFADAS